MIVPGYNHHEMNQGVGGHEASAGDRGGPVHRPPRAGGQRKTGNQERRADVLDKVWIIGAGLGCLPGTFAYQKGPANSIMAPLTTDNAPRMAAMDRCMGTSCALDEH